MARKQETLKTEAENTQYSQLAEKGNNRALSVGGKTEIEELTRRPRYGRSLPVATCVTLSVTHERAFVTRERASHRENRDSFLPLLSPKKIYTNYLVETHIRREFEGLFLFGANDI